MFWPYVDLALLASSKVGQKRAKAAMVSARSTSREAYPVRSASILQLSCGVHCRLRRYLRSTTARSTDVCSTGTPSGQAAPAEDEQEGGRGQGQQRRGPEHERQREAAVGDPLDGTDVGLGAWCAVAVAVADAVGQRRISPAGTRADLGRGRARRHARALRGDTAAGGTRGRRPTGQDDIGAGVVRVGVGLPPV